MFRSRGRQNSDWSRDDIGDFFVPREEEYSWNDQKRSRQQSTDDAATVPRESEEGDDAEDEDEDKDEEEYMLTRRFTEGEVDRFVAMREQLWKRRQKRRGGGVEGAWWLDPLLFLYRARSMSGCQLLPSDIETPGASVRSSEDVAPALIEDSDRQMRSDSIVTLNAAEEKVFFKKVKKSMPKTQRCISDEILRKLDHERKGCTCKCCVEWNELRLEVRKGSWIKQRWKGRVLTRAKKLISQEHIHGLVLRKYLCLERICLILVSQAKCKRSI